jgi:hypothetical protein
MVRLPPDERSRLGTRESCRKRRRRLYMLRIQNIAPEKLSLWDMNPRKNDATVNVLVRSGKCLK